MTQFIDEWQAQQVAKVKEDQYGKLGSKIIDEMVKEVARDLQAEANAGK